MGQLTIADVRAKFPQYDNLSDRELADAIHQRYYPDMDRSQFNNSIGFNGAPTAEPRPRPRPTPDPQAAIDSFVEQTQSLEFPTPPAPRPDPRIAPTQPTAPDAPSMPFVGDAPARPASPELPQPAPSQAIPPRAMPANPIPQLNGPGPGGGMQELIDLGVLPQRYTSDPFARPAPEAPVAPAATEPDPFEGEGFIPLAQRRGQQFARGATEAFAAVPEAVAIQMANADRRDVSSGEYKMALADRYEAELGQIATRTGEIEVALGINGNPRPSRENRLDSEQRAALEAEYQEIMGRRNQIELAIGEGGLEAYRADALADMTTRANLNEEGVVTPAADREMFSYGDVVREASADTFGTPDPRDTSFWAGVAEGGGNMTGMAVTALATSVVTTPLGGVAMAGGQGAAMNSSQMYREAIEMGADEETARRAANWGAAIGASEIIPINRALKLLPPRLRGQIGQGFLRRFADIAQSSGEEAAQEYLATVANNIVAQNLYDPDRGWTDGATEAALVGAVLGAGTGTVGTLLDTRGDAPANARPEAPEPTPSAETPPEPATEVQQPVAPTSDDAQAATQAPIGAAPEQRTPPVQPEAPAPASPIDELAQAATPAPTQPVPAEPVGEGALPAQQPAGEPSPPASAPVARVDGFNPDQWQAVPGMKDGQPTGRTWMTNDETGETISKEDYDRRVAAIPQSPEGGGNVAPTRGEADEVSQTPSVDAGTGQPAADGSVRSSDAGVPAGPDGDAGTVARNAETSQDPAAPGAGSFDPAPVRNDSAPTVDAGTARPSPQPGVAPTAQTQPAQQRAGQALDPELEGNETLAMQRGSEAFAAGDQRVLPPTIDATDEVAARAWYAGWDQANINAPVPDGDQAAPRAGAQETPAGPERIQSVDDAKTRWNSMSEQQRIELAQRVNPSWQPSGGATILSRPWDALLPASQDRIFKGMQRLEADAQPAEQVDAETDADALQERAEAAVPSGYRLVSFQIGNPPEVPHKVEVRTDNMGALEMERGSGMTPEAAVGDAVAKLQEKYGQPGEARTQASHQSEWDGMDAGQREQLLRSMGGFDKRDGSLTKGGQNAIKKDWGSLSNAARDKIDSAWSGMEDTERFLSQTPEQQQAEVDQAQADAEAETEPFAAQAAENQTRNDQHRDAISLVTDGKWRDLVSKDGVQPDIAAGAILYGMEYKGQGKKAHISSDDAVKALEALGYSRPAKADIETFIRSNASIGNTQQGKSINISGPVDQRAYAMIYLDKSGMYPFKGTFRQPTEFFEAWLKEDMTNSPELTGAAADPAFKAAKDSGKLEVVSVTPESEAKRDGPTAGEVGSTKLASDDRPLSEVGKQWDSMTPTDRAAHLLAATPTADKDRVGRLAQKDWSDIADSIKASIARRLPKRDLTVAGRHWAGRINAERRALEQRAGLVPGEFKTGVDWDKLDAERQRLLARFMPQRIFDNAAPTPEAVADAAAEADPNPTDAQKEAENYRKGHISWNGLNISIENAKGSERSGTDPDGKSWSVTMPAHYGYIKRTEGADGDHVDVYIGEHTDSDKVFIIDQVNLDRSFDEHKVMIGFRSNLLARGTHSKAFSDGKGEIRRGGVTEMTVAEFKDWLENGDTSSPLSDTLKAEIARKKEATAKPPQSSNREDASDTQADDSTDADLDHPTVRLGERLSAMIGNDDLPSTNMQLMKLAAEDFGGTIAEGAFSPKDAYEALELAMNLFATRDFAEGGPISTAYDPSRDTAGAKAAVTGLQNVLDTFPTQTRRDTETDAFQQFSTPPTYGYAVNWIANIQEGERVLEPSAGNGGIAVFAKNAGAKVDVNELAERRVPSLKALGFDRVTTENAEQIGNIWADDASRSYDVVVMNPPFSASAGRTSKNTSATGAKHIDQALSVLKDGGRLVAIMGHTFQPGNSRVAPFFKRLEANGYSLRANVVVKGDQVYKKYGTTYDNRLLVIDKVAPAEGSETLKGEVATIPELIDMMEGIRNEASNRRTKDDTVATDAAVTSGEGSRTPDADGGKPGAGKSERVSEPDDLGGAADQPGQDGRSDPSDGKPARAAKRGAGSDGQGKAGATDGGKRTSGSRGATSPDRRKPTVRVTDAAETQVEETSGGFAKYRPSRVRIEGAQEHPIALVESSAMATVNPPKPNYDLQLPAKMVKNGLLSEAQLEQVMYAGAAHSEMLPSSPDQPPRRKGYYIGDGTGVGKTREIAGIVADNWAQGRKRHILISKDKKLLKSARRDFDNVGMKSVPIEDLGKVKSDASVPSDAQGVLFATYSTIGKSAPAGKKSRLDQIIEWVGPDFDGTIVFDEAHLAGNAMPVKGKRGTSKPSATALAVVELQKQLPNARVVYASATAATEVYNLAYADRLGLWGPGTPFPTVESFVTQIDKGGVAAMEVVARDMKQMGVYMARSISFDGVEYGKVEHELTPDQRAMYDAAAEGWQTVLGNVQTVIEEHTEGGGRQRGAALAQFWGAHQRFFQQVLTSMQMPTVLQNIEADLKAGYAPVVQIVNTNEAATKRAMSKMEDGDTLDDIDITPREDLIQYLETSFPVHQYENYEDDNGNVRQRPVQDSKGDFVVNREAVRIRDELIDKLGAMTLPGNPLDMLIEKFGADNVAEITGRSQRIVMKNGKRVTERRSQNKALAEAGEFQGGKRDVLVFSDAGGTGMDFHADKDVKNTKRRSHYVLQAGWRADRAIQGFGRTHRTNQAQPPIYKLAGTNLSGHKRFTSSIARRLDQLGALTKGQKDASGSSMFNATDNLENEFAETAVEALFYEIWRGEIDGFTPADAEKELGLNLVGEKGFNVSKIPPVTQFLNRLLNTTIDRQNLLFDRFVEHMETAVQQAIEDGNFTAGVEAIEHDGAELIESKEAFRDDTTGAHSEYQMVKLTKAVEVTPFVDMDTAFANIRYKKHKDTGAVYAFRPASSRTNDRGQVVPTYHRYSPTDRSIIDSQDYQFRYEMIKADEAETLWNEAIAEAPATREETLHMVTGALLPIWDRLPSSSPKIVRLQLDDGRSLLGREIPDVELTRTLENLGVTGPEIDMSGAEIQASVMQGKTVLLSSGHKLVRRKVGGEQRIEIVPPKEAAYSDTMPGGTLQRIGFQIEKINYKARAFAATGEKGLPAIDAFMQGKSIVNVTMERDRLTDGPVQPYGESMMEGEVFKALSGQLRKMGLSDVEIQFDPDMAQAGKVYTDHFGKMVVTIGNTLNPRWTLGHEAMHIYRHMGVISDTEWAVLSVEAESKWMERYDVAARYPDLTKAEQIEEAVAEAFGEALQKNTGFRTTGPVRAALRKMNQFLKAVRNWAKGLGLKSPDDVIEAMARGDFAKRREVKGWESQAARLLKERRRPNAIERKQGGLYLPDRYVWDTLANGNGNIFARIKEAGGAAKDRFDLVRTRFQDRFLPVLRAQQVIERQMGAKIPEELNAYLAEEMYSGRTGFKLDKIDQDYTSKIIQIIGNTKGMTAETVGRFLYARHAAERNERIAEINPDMPDGGSGMGTDEADAILKDIKASPQSDAYQEIADLIDGLREWTINERVEMGLMKKDEADAWRKAYSAYVPLKGWAETDFSDAELDVTGIGRGYNVRGDETRRALGRKTEAFNPLIAAITQAQEVAVRSEKNRVGQHFYRLAKDVPAKGLWEVKKVETTRVFNETTGLVEERNMSPITLMQAADEMAVKVDGEEYRIVFNDPRLARSATRVGVESLGALMKPLSMFSRYVSAVNTMLNPEFVMVNFARDTVTANVNIQSKELGTKIQKGMMKDLPKAMRGAYRGLGGKSDTQWSQYFQEFSEAGGKVSFWVLENPEANQSTIERRMKREANGVKGMALGLVTPSTELNPVLRALDRINLAVDNAIRLAAFVHARKNGMSAQEAASLSKNLTVNFNRRGDYGSAINAAYVFANAAMQGTHIMFKAMKSRRVQAIVTGMVLIGYLLDQANAYLSEEDEDGQLAYDKLPDYKSERSLVIMLGRDSGDALTIPMPYGYNVFTYMGNRISKAQRGAISAEEAVGDTALAAFSSFSPINGNSFLGLITPTALDPAVEIATNTDWLGRPIYPDYPNMTEPDSQRFYGSVTNLSRIIAEKANAWTGGTYAESGYVDVSPESIDHIAGFLTGGVGRFFGRNVDLFSKIFNGEDVEINDIPVARTLYTDTGAWLDSSLYFDRRNEVRAARNAARAYEAAGDPVPDHIRWKADLYDVQLQAERYRRGTKTVEQDTDRAYLLLNMAYLRAWQANTPYSSESIFD